MRDEPIHDRIAALNARTPAETTRLTSRMVGACTLDRTEPGALGWVRRWRLERIGATLPECSCARGRCGVCN